jgi:gamma-glutamylcyclotransferase (GGCT)/AIG2-like uncharacterized protein YtfP
LKLCPAILVEIFFRLNGQSIVEVFYSKRMLFTNFIIFYGSLLSHYSEQEKLNIKNKIELIEKCFIPGELYDLGDWPGLFKTDGHVVGELHLIKQGCNEEVLSILDQFEEYNPVDHSGEFLREITYPISSIYKPAWVYYYKGSIEDKQLIASGDWHKHYQNKIQATIN